MSGMKKMRPRVRRTLRAASGRKIVIENFQRGGVSLVGIMDGHAWCAAWLRPAQLRQLADVARKILK